MQEPEAKWVKYRDFEPGKLYRSRCLQGTVEVVETPEGREYYWNMWDGRRRINPRLDNIAREVLPCEKN